MLKFEPCGMANETHCSRYQYHRFQRAGWRAGIILDKWAEDAFIVIVTSDILAEYFEVINRPKFRLKQATIDRITRYSYQFAEFVVPEERFQLVEADPKDNKFLEAAIAGNAELYSKRRYGSA